MRNLLLLLFVIACLSNSSLSQVCPVVTNPNQYNQTTNLGGAAENPTLTPFTFSYTAGAGTNRLMILFVTYETENTNGPNNFSSVTYGGKTLTNVVNQTVTAAGTQQNRLGIYYLKEANIASAVGTTVSISFTNPGGASPNGSINGVAVSTIMLENVNQATPLINIQNLTNTSTMTITVPSALSATSGNFILAAVNMALATATVGPSNASYAVFISQQVSGSHTHSVSYKKIITAANEQPGFTANTTTRQIIGSVEVQSAGLTSPCNRILPLHLISFEGSLINNSVRLNWQTSIESAIQSYQVQKSTDINSGFAAIGSVISKNTNNSAYSFIDRNLNSGQAFYRLQIIHTDGSITYSTTIHIDKNAISKPTTVATLLNSTINIFTSGVSNEDVVIQLTDVTGKMLFSKKVKLSAGFDNLEYNTGHDLAKGIYFLSITSGTNSEVFKLFKE